MRTPHIQQFTLYNNRGQSVLDKCLLNWEESPEGNLVIFGPIIRYNWIVDGKQYEFMNMNDKNRVWLHELPDSTGFICFERSKPLSNHNCVLLDAYGKERIRLQVPWELTENPRISKELEMHFCNIDGPYESPKDGKIGKYGVTARIAPPEGDSYAHAWCYYFELDYCTGKFLWGTQIQD